MHRVPKLQHNQRAAGPTNQRQMHENQASNHRDAACSPPTEDSIHLAATLTPSNYTTHIMPCYRSCTPAAVHTIHHTAKSTRSYVSVQLCLLLTLRELSSSPLPVISSSSSTIIARLHGLSFTIALPSSFPSLAPLPC